MNKLEQEEMRVYTDLKEYVDKKLKNGADKFEDLKEYHLFCRINQMYYELLQIKLSYQKVLEKDFKEVLIKKAVQTRQTLYNSRIGNPRKQDLLDGVNSAIDILSEILTVGNYDDKE